MTEKANMTAEEARRAQLDEWYETYGLVGMIRRIQELRPGKGDFTAERHKLTGHLTFEEIVARINQRRRERGEEEIL